MKTLIPPQDQLLLSRYLDGDLSDKEQSEVQLRMTREPELRSAYVELERLRSVLKESPKLSSDPYFWTRVNAAIQSKNEEERNLLPFPKKYIPAFAVGAFVILVGAGLMLVQNRYSLLKFWERQTEAVRTAYQQGIVQSSLMPFFTSLDADRTLQFALYGTLSLDEEKGTTLKVDERSNSGYRIEVQKELPRKMKKVTMAEFMDEVNPSVGQRASLDSVLKAAKEELEASVLVGADDAVAINVDLHRLNKAVVSGLVACLQPEQRVKLNRMLAEHEAPYTVESRSKEVRQAGDVIKSFRGTTKRPEFLVVTADSLHLLRFHVNMDEMRQRMTESKELTEEMVQRRERAVRQLVSTTAVFDAPMIASPDMPRMSVRSRRDRLTVELTEDSASEGVYFFNMSVAPRIPVMILNEMNGQNAVVGMEQGGTPQPGGVRGRVFVAPRIPTPSTGIRGDTTVKDDRKPRKPFKLDLKQ